MSAYLLDTNVLSELAKPHPDPGIVNFLSELEDAYISVLTIHELKFGIECLPEKSNRKETLNKVVEGLLDTFRESLLPIDEMESRVAGKIRADAQAAGRTIHVIDSLIAATGLVKNLTVVTRNEKDFAHSGVTIANPWVG
jgi:predicted nucleic acid-binding protein